MTRAAATTLNYVLTLGIAAILVSGLVVAGGNVLRDQRTGAARTGLQVAGQHLASDVSSVDRLVAAGSDTDVRLVSSLPRSVAGEEYVVEIRPHPTLANVAVLTLTTVTSDVSVNVSVRHRAPIQTPVRISGGTLVVEYHSGGAGQVVVSSA